MPSPIEIYIKVDPILRDFYTSKYGNSVFVPLRFEYLKNLIRDRSQTKQAGPILIPNEEEKRNYLKVVLPYESDRNVFSYCRLNDKAMRDINSYLRSHFNEMFLNYVAGYLTAQEQIIPGDFKLRIIKSLEMILNTSFRPSQLNSIKGHLHNIVRRQEQQNAIESFIIQWDIYFSDNNYQALKKLWDRSLIKQRCLKEKIIPQVPTIGLRNRRKLKDLIKEPSLF
jgi:hypothetical protein